MSTARSARKAHNVGGARYWAPGFPFEGNYSWGPYGRGFNVGANLRPGAGMTPIGGGFTAPAPTVCYDEATNRMVGPGHYLHGWVPPVRPRIRDVNGVKMAFIDVAGDAAVDVPVCNSNRPNGGSGTVPVPPGTGVPVPPGGGIPLPPGGNGGGGGTGGTLPPTIPTPPPNGSCGMNGNFGGWPGFGFGVYPCPPAAPPAVPMGRDGCPDGWVQCKQPIPTTSTAVAAGATATITVRPRREIQPYQFVYTGDLGVFQINSVTVDGTDYLDGAIPADIYQPAMTDLSVAWGKFSSNTPLLMSITNFSAGPEDFRGAILGAAARGS